MDWVSFVEKKKGIKYYIFVSNA